MDMTHVPGHSSREEVVRMRNAETLLFLTEKPAVADCLVQAIEAEFPRIGVRFARNVEHACLRADSPVALVVVDLDLLPELESIVARLIDAHPTATVALLQVDSRRPTPAGHVLRSKLVSGVLPMHLKLDVWLSVIRLLLHGGEYFPIDFLRPLLAEPADATTPRVSHTGDISVLTTREIEVLEMVARGLQNKIIAASLTLSEHTVKIHLHNIITKLGVSNRTEAAAAFHRQRGQSQYGAA